MALQGLQRMDSEIVEMKDEILTNLDDLKQRDPQLGSNTWSHFQKWHWFRRVEITEEGFGDLTERLQKEAWLHLPAKIENQVG